MRNFITLFLLLILIFSIGSVIFKPVVSNSGKEKQKQEEPSTVKDLLSGASQNAKKYDYTEQEEEKEEYSINNERNYQTDYHLERRANEEVAREDKNLTTTLDFVSENTDKKTKVVTQQEKEIHNQIEKLNNGSMQYNEATEELKRKYNNNPNAEVSQEDVMKIMQMMIKPNN